MLSIPDLGWGSAVGNSLDNGDDVPARRHGTSWRPCGLEVVLAERRRSCAPAWARCPTTRSGTPVKRGLGPVLDPLFMQSNYGIVTRMGVWLQRTPDALPCRPRSTAPRRGHPTSRRLSTRCATCAWRRTITACPILFNTLIAAVMAAGGSNCPSGRRPDARRGDSRPDGGLDLASVAGRSAARSGVRRRSSPRAWSGSARRGRIPGSAVLHSRTYRRRTSHHELEVPHDKIQAGIPTSTSARTWSRTSAGATSGSHPAVPLTGRDVRAAVDLLRDLI